MAGQIVDINIDALQKRVDESGLYSNKFGTFTKTDYEVLMFTIYLDSLKEYARDYDISIALGIPESKVRNLRVKSQLLYPRDIDWIKEMNNAISHGYYDSNTGCITISIEDPNVQNLLRNKVEKNYGVVGLTLNNKQLILPVESFLLLAAFSEDNPEQVIKDLNSLLSKETENRNRIEKKSLKERFLKNVPDMVGFISSALTVYETGRPIIHTVIQLMKNTP